MVLYPEIAPYLHHRYGTGGWREGGDRFELLAFCKEALDNNPLKTSQEPGEAGPLKCKKKNPKTSPFS